jgi:hypothetical protein
VNTVNAVAPASCFLVEWYQTGPAALRTEDAAAELSRAAAIDGHVPPTALVMAFNMPDDQTFFGVFSAVSVEAVVQACRYAGWPADRITANVHVWLCH